MVRYTGNVTFIQQHINRKTVEIQVCIQFHEELMQTLIKTHTAHENVTCNILNTVIKRSIKFCKLNKLIFSLKRLKM